MAERKAGMGSRFAGVLEQATTPLEPPEGPAVADDGPEPAAAEGQGRGAVVEPKATRQRRRRPPVVGETRGRKLHLPDGIHDRLWLLARQRRTSVSAVAADILDKNLPRFRVEREG